MQIFNRKETIEKRRQLRANQTEAEKILWSKLRNKQLAGYKFFRQYGIGSYIADFYCPLLKIVIEVDGSQHFSKEGLVYDKEREKIFKDLGIRTIRFSNIDVLNNIEGVYQSIQDQLPPAPSLLKRGSSK
jgi:very-short-patch-repair endonuclease